MVLLTDFLNGSEWKIEEEDHVKFQMFKNTGQLGIALLEDCHILEFPVALPPELDYNLPVVYKGINLDDKDKDANQIHEASAKKKEKKKKEKEETHDWKKKENTQKS